MTLLTHKMHEAIGRYCWEILGFQESSLQAAQANDQLVALIEALRTRSEPSSFEMLITTRHGKQRWLAISCAPLPSDEREALQATVIGLHDISQFKAVDQMKSDFVAMVSHELRTPLTTVSGSVETLRLLEPGTDTESYQEVLGILGQQTRRLRRVVEELLKPAISRLRQKVEEDPSHPTLIQTVHGIGYRLVLAPASTDIASTSEPE